MTEAWLPRESLLLGLAEVSVALTGFAGIVVFLGRRAAGEWSEADRTRFWAMIEFGLLALMFSLSPLLFWELFHDLPTTWAASSALGALVGSITLAAGVRRSLRIAAAGDSEANFVVGNIFIVLTALILLGLVFNAAGIGFARSSLPHLVALFWYLTLACLFFLRLLRFW